MNELVMALFGYLTVPIVAVATRRFWPAQAKFLVAAALAAGAAYLAVLVDHVGDVTFVAWEQAFAYAFLAQQATWHLKLPGAGTPEVTEPLIELFGSGAKPFVEPEEIEGEPVETDEQAVGP